MNNHQRKITVLRHGQSIWNKENRFTGFVDIPLSEQGKNEAMNAGQILAGHHFEKIYTSTLSRAQRTADLVLLATKSNQHLAIGKNTGQFYKHSHDDLRERDYGDLSGLNKLETMEKYGVDQVHIWRRSYDTPPPGGESLFMTVQNRVGPYAKNILLPDFKSSKGDFLLAAHGNTIRALFVVLGLFDSHKIPSVEIKTGTPFFLVHEDNGSWSLNDPHNACVV